MSTSQEQAKESSTNHTGNALVLPDQPSYLHVAGGKVLPGCKYGEINSYKEAVSALQRSGYGLLILDGLSGWNWMVNWIAKMFIKGRKITKPNPEFSRSSYSAHLIGGK